MFRLLVLLMFSSFLGLTSFGIGILPLSITFSGENAPPEQSLETHLTLLQGTHMSTLTSLGTGLLLGAALGVIIPEYVREFSSANRSFSVEG